MTGFVGDVDEDEEKVVPQGPPQEVLVEVEQPRVVLYRADGTPLVAKKRIGFL